MMYIAIMLAMCW